MTLGKWEFDSDQCAAAQIDPWERQIVLAGPGSGKTQVVAGLLQHLVEDEGLSGTDEVLVISFSRAAVAAVQARARRSGTRRPTVTARTLDSLAGQLLDELAEEEWRHLPFDDRVVKATRLLQSEGWEGLRGFAHLVVDEVQDVVGVRADFLLAVFAGLDEEAGFTLLGDPMQAVYDFQLDSRSRTTSLELLDEVRNRWRVVERRLKGQYRARTPEAAKAISMGPELLSVSEPRRQARLLESVISRLQSIGALSSLGRLLPRWQGSTAVLCRTNGEALLAARELRGVGLNVSLQRSAHEAGVVSWVADVLGDQAVSTVTREDVIASMPSSSALEGTLAWTILRDLARSRGPSLDILTIARRLMTGTVPVDLLLSTGASVVVSTIHRAKGLEFDNIVLVGPETWLVEGDDEALDRAVRAAFVAVTRGQERIVTAASLRMRGVRLDNRSHRWVRTGRASWQTFGFEIVGRDTRTAAPIGPDYLAVQHHLRESVQEGDVVDLELDPRRSTLQLPVYRVVHAGHLIGLTSHDFGETLARRIRTAEKRSGRPWPELSGAVVEGVETIGGPPQPLHVTHGVGRWGLWLNVRLNGMVDLSW